MTQPVIHPGEHLAEELETLGMSAAALAREIRVPTNRITGIVNGERAITGDTALRLGHFFGTSPEFWLNLQSLYELRLAQRKEGHQDSSDAEAAERPVCAPGSSCVTGANEARLHKLDPLQRRCGMSDFDAALAGFAALDEAALGRPWPFRDKPMDVRYALYRTLEDAQEVLVDIAARPHPESRRILALAQQAFGDLRGLVIGLPDDLLDKAPSPGEWSVGEVLRHVLAIEQRYAIQTLWAVERADKDPVRVPADRLPPTAPPEIPGGAGEILARIAEARAETNRSLGSLAPAQMTRPTQWTHYDVDVRFRLHRFAAHLVESAVQCEKNLAVLGWPLTEGRRIARRLAAALGEIEGLGGLAEARQLEARLAERFASVS